jgi:hypothetical protein
MRVSHRVCVALCVRVDLFFMILYYNLLGMEELCC